MGMFLKGPEACGSKKMRKRSDEKDNWAL